MYVCMYVCYVCTYVVCMYVCMLCVYVCYVMYACSYPAVTHVINTTNTGW